MINMRLTRRQHGFVMLEALVGGLIFAIGVLGIVALQASMTQAQSVGKSRADAIYLADELVGLLWADLPRATQYTTASCSTNTQCTDWSAKVGRALPGGTPAVTVDGAGSVAITISWSTQAGTQSYTTVTAVTP